MAIGRLHSVETFGTVDGPGIRYVLFLQGCHLQCKYCHNKDSCNLNGGYEEDAETIIKDIKKYKDYIVLSKGGVTASGGEPLLQPHFISYLFKRLQEYNFHTALDTSGSVLITKEIQEVLKYTNLVILDIKHINNQKCIELTGKPNTNTLNFAKYLSNNSIPVWIRQVLIPGITDNEKDLIELKNFLKTLSNIQKFEFLPYHTMGKYKWEELNLEYPFKNIRAATDEDIKKAEEIINAKN